MSFSWNEKKAAANLRKHGISFQEAESCFSDPLGEAFENPDLGSGECREVLRAYSDAGRLLVVVFLDDGRVFRIISARQATASEARHHAQGI